MPHSHPLSGARWIGAPRLCQSPVIVRKFTVSNPKDAILYVTGLGYFEAKINGEAVTEDRFLPVISDYEPRDLSKFIYPLFDKLTHRVYYCRYDVSHLLRPGENELTIQLGNGWYRQTERSAEGPISYSEDLKTIYSLHLGDTVINSDGSEKWYGSEIVYNQLFIGEVIDPTIPRGFPLNVQLMDAPAGVLTEQIGTPDRVIRTLKPKLIATVGNRKIYDAGENISGVVRVHTSAPYGSRITLRFTENLDENFEFNYHSVGGGYPCPSSRYQIMTDTFICDGTQRSFEPKFCWHAFRYFDVVGETDDLEVLVIHSNTPVTASFDSPSEGLNYLYETYIRTQLNNMHGSIPSDCPHRERLGYTGDGQVCAQAAMMILDSREFYRKWIQDILDCQDTVSGHVQHTAPLMGGGGGPGGWGCAMVIVPYVYYRHYGETAMLEKCYQPMRRWIDYLVNHSENGLVVREEKDGWCLGDWCTLVEPVELPAAYVNSCFFMKSLEMLMEIAPLVGHEDHAAEYARLREEIGQAIRREFFNPETGRFCNNIQGADAYALWVGLAGRETAAKMAARYDALGHFDTGFLGTDILMEMLCKYGYIDTALKLLESEDLGSYLYMKRHGATTIWENWGGAHSHDHPMFGACVRQFFSSLLGIQGDAGYEDLRIAPQIPNNLPWVSGSMEIPAGNISIRWERTADGIRFAVTLPAGKAAAFRYGDREMTLSPGHSEFVI